MKKKKWRKPLPFSFKSLIIPLILLIIGYLLPSIETLNSNGVELFGYKFSTFEFSDGSGFDTEFWYPQNHTRVISISNKAEFSLNPYLIIDLTSLLCTCFLHTGQ